MTSPTTPSPETFLAGPGALRVIKRPIPVQVRFASAAGVVQTLEGPVRHVPGDAVLTGPHGEQWPVGRAAFLASYAPVPPTAAGDDGAYRKRPTTVLARQLDTPMSVPAGAGPDLLHGRSGDWVLGYPDGSFGVIRDNLFWKTYGVAQE